MATHDYHFITDWQVIGTIEEVATIIGDAEGLARWWPSVYLDVKVTDPGDSSGVGKVVDLYTKGWLPYTLRWQFKVTASDPPHTFSLDAYGDFNGRGIWTFRQNGDFVDIEYDWRIRADKPLLKYLSFMMKPFFSANHRWAMARGLESLKLELLRRRARSPEEDAAIPPPPAPSTIAPGLAVASLAAGVALAVAAVAVVKRKRPGS